jgi:heat shock protein HtpX
MKRIFLFLLTNIAVMVVLSISAHLLGVDHYLTRHGIDFGALLGLAALMGFGGAFLSLALSKWMAKSSVGASVIEQPRTADEHWLLETVRGQAEAAGIGMPEVAIYESADVNAFATGMSRNDALVAVSTGLLQTMTRDEAEAVLGHEISHVANGDMVTLTLIQGVVNTFVIFLATVIGYVVDRAMRGDREGSAGPGIGFMVVRMVAEVLLGILASMVVMWFSRHREFHADAGGARLAGRDAMIAALERLSSLHGQSRLPQQMAAFGISGGSAIMQLFSSHPPLAERIAALRAGGRD